MIYSCKRPQAKEDTFKVSENPEIVQFTPKKPTRITLRRNSNGSYSWELRGEDVEEIIAADKKLKAYTETTNH